MKIRAFFIACALLVTSIVSAQPPTIVPHCAPNCEACSSCQFCGQDCTLTQGYWKNHTECWPAEFDAGTVKLCNILWIDILNTPVMGRPWYNLAHQWIAAMLNQANGADASCIDCSDCLEGCTDALTTAGQLLSDNCANMNDKTPNSLFTCLAMLFDDYNMGMIEGCPEHCGGSNPCETCDCGLCCPQDCTMCLDCPNICELCTLADCPNRCDGCPLVCPNPCTECPECPACPACICRVENECCSSSSSSSAPCCHKNARDGNAKTRATKATKKTRTVRRNHARKTVRKSRTRNQVRNNRTRNHARKDVTRHRAHKEPVQN